MGAAFYYVAIIIVIEIIMLNLLLAIMLGNFDKARRFSEKKIVLYAFEDLKNNEHKFTFEQSIDLIFGCCSSHVKYEVLEWKKPVDLANMACSVFGGGGLRKI